MKAWLLRLAVIAVLGTGGWYGYGWWQANGHQLLAQMGLAQPAAPAASPAAGRPGGGGPQAVPVQVAPASPGLVVERVESVGTARANESITIAPKNSGFVSRLNFREGDVVRTGTVLVEMDDREVQAQVEALRATRDNARVALERARALVISNAATQARVDELAAALRTADGNLRAAEARLQDLRILAPFAGQVGLRRVSVGAFVTPGSAITTLDDLSVIKLEFSVPELALSRLRAGLQVTATADSLPGETFSGVITAVDSRVDPVTRAITVRAELPNPTGLLRPGVFMLAELEIDRRESALLIPEEALVPQADRQFVYVVEEGRARLIEIRIGQRLVGKVEVVSGLSAGQQIVVAGVQRLRNGVPVRVLPPPGQGGGGPGGPGGQRQGGAPAAGTPQGIGAGARPAG
ncbi:MAG: efflux RND transporter periplasmic adaptor subunit [Alphaproteobacteria bacterium]|nr:efflux RND transporter periplasmic adaptor subunit [Alphaproteobacteria bacterium]